MSATRYVRDIVGFVAVALTMAVGTAGDVAAQPNPPKMTSKRVEVQATERRQAQRQIDRDQRINDGTSQAVSGTAADIALSTPPAKWVTKEHICSTGSIDAACSATIIDCRMAPGASGPPRLIWWRQEGAEQWYGPTQACLPGYPAPPDVNDPTVPRVAAPPPPVPTIDQVREAFMALPFAMPEVSMQPVGQKTLVNLPTFYEAVWPEGAGLKPGDVSEPVQLLSWSIEFKIASKDYRYDFGDDSSSDWTKSTGGVYPDGDITHTYETTGRRQVKVDARLVGQYRVNGGAWQDLGAVADLQDEPVAQLEVLGTRTRLVND